MQNKELQLFILPYAGGSIAAFKRLTDLIDERIEVITVEYAGRGTRAKEPLAESVQSLLDDAIAYCQERRKQGLPYAVMGYSMGSVLAYEMIARQEIFGQLRHFFISAEVSPKDRWLELRKVEDPTEERILERARRLGGLEERMLKNKRFFDIYIKPMLSDYRHFFDYQFSDPYEKLHVNTTFFYCQQDTALEDVKKWDELIDGEFAFYEMGKDHFFINQRYEEMAGIINRTLVQ